MKDDIAKNFKSLPPFNDSIVYGYNVDNVFLRLSSLLNLCVFWSVDVISKVYICLCDSFNTMSVM